ncbi:hypothetical protein [Nonomuraea sp. NPDC050786]
MYNLSGFVERGGQGDAVAIAQAIIGHTATWPRGLRLRRTAAFPGPAPQ